MLAEVRWQRRHAQIDRTISGLDLDPSVLRETLLGDVKLRENLDPGQKRGVHPARKLEVIAQYSIDAQAHPHFERARLDVDVARPQRHCVEKDPIAQHHG
jgi:hypothetical protein